MTVYSGFLSACLEIGFIQKRQTSCENLHDKFSLILAAIHVACLPAVVLIALHFIYYGLQSEGDNVLGSVHLSICPLVCPPSPSWTVWPWPWFFFVCVFEISGRIRIIVHMRSIDFYFTCNNVMLLDMHLSINVSTKMWCLREPSIYDREGAKKPQKRGEPLIIVGGGGVGHLLFFLDNEVLAFFPSTMGHLLFFLSKVGALPFFARPHRHDD